MAGTHATHHGSTDILNREHLADGLHHIEKKDLRIFCCLSIVNNCVDRRVNQPLMFGMAHSIGPRLGKAEWQLTNTAGIVPAYDVFNRHVNKLVGHDDLVIPGTHKLAFSSDNFDKMQHSNGETETGMAHVITITAYDSPSEIDREQTCPGATFDSPEPQRHGLRVRQLPTDPGALERVFGVTTTARNELDHFGTLLMPLCDNADNTSLIEDMLPKIWESSVEQVDSGGEGNSGMAMAVRRAKRMMTQMEAVTRKS